MTDAKAGWDKIKKKAGQLLARAVPGNSDSVAQGRRSFMEVLADDKGRMARIKKKHDGTSEGDKKIIQMLIDWYKVYKSHPSSFKSSPSAPTTSSTSPGIRTTPMATSSSSPSASSSTTAAWATAASTKRKGRGKEEDDSGLQAKWAELVPACDTQLLMPDSLADAPKLDISSTIDRAVGYHFCNARAAAEIVKKFIESPNPIVIIMPRCSPMDREGISKALDGMRERAFRAIFPSISNASMLVEDTDGRVKTVDVTMVQIDELNPILPANSIADHSGDAVATQLPDLDMDLPSLVDIQVSVLAPLCRDLGLEDWWTKLAARPIGVLRNDINKKIAFFQI